MTEKNAIIDSAILDDGERGLVTSWLQLNYGGSGQGFGGYTLYLSQDYKNHKAQGNFAGHWIYRCMQIAGVSSWDKVNGRTIRVRLTSDGLDGKIIAIGHIINDDWFNPEEEFKKLNA